MTVSLDRAYWLGLLVSVVLPVLVGLVTTRVTSAGRKAVLLLALSTADGFLVEVIHPVEGFNAGTAAIMSLVAFAIGVLMHFGLYKPTGVSAKAQDSLVTAGQPRSV
ncbi:hypothetical protein ACFWIB_15160 [Streptomyces sp. NPDC127051]|uniref:hypothetical protein n=1 Tax=Streptomyces sp. NPDC127051 TaxID=3347119 RepID=UPI003666282A